MLGGNIFDFVSRLSDEEYRRAAAVVTTVIQSVSNSCTKNDSMVVVPPSYHKKSDHGDIDCLVWDGAGLRVENLIGPLSAALECKSVEENPNGASFAVPFGNNRWFQLDVQVVNGTKAEFEFCQRFHSYNDLGNLIGRVAASQGFKFGSKGLCVPVYHEGAIVDEIKVTDDFSAAIEFLGFDPDWFDDGFETLDEIFDYVTESRYFEPKYYRLSNRSNRSRKRDLKRPAYMAFVDRVQKTWPEEFDHEYDDRGQRKYNKEHLVRAFQWFGSNLAARYDAAIEAYIEQEWKCQQFNKDIIELTTGYGGQRLGQLIRSFVDEVGMPIRQLVLDVGPDQAFKTFVDFYRKYRVACITPTDSEQSR